MQHSDGRRPETFARAFYQRAGDRNGSGLDVPMSPLANTSKEPPMKKIVAIIRPFKLDDVKEALSEMGVPGMTVTEVTGFGRTGGKSTEHRGTVRAVDLLPKVKLEVVVHDGMVKQALDAVEQAANTRRAGDGKIFVSEIGNAVRIRTGELGDEAI
jgi:nitrogen regulatory protein P-II 1